MQFKGMCIAAEDSSYTSKSHGKVEQITLTCVDNYAKTRLKDTVDLVLPKEDFDRIKEVPVGKIFDFEVSEIRTGFGSRFRFTARLPAPAAK